MHVKSSSDCHCPPFCHHHKIISGFNRKPLVLGHIIKEYLLLKTLIKSMPVIRNLSLPSSIESRKFKKRPDDLHALQHCFSVPDDLQWKNSSFLCPSERKEVNTTTVSATSDCHQHQQKKGSTTTPVADVDAMEQATPKPHFQATDNLSKPTENLLPPESGKLGSSSSRSSLSQPCLSRSSSVTATSIFPHLFLGSESDVADKSLMEENKITSVLNVSLSCARPGHLDDEHFKRIAVKDNYQENISPFLDEAVQFIELARQKNERVLVHCVAGVSRSATVAIAYVMHYLRLTFEEAYRFVKEKRPTISPNFNFLGQLIEFEKELRDRGRVTGNPNPKKKERNASSAVATCTTIKVTNVEQKVIRVENKVENATAVMPVHRGTAKCEEPKSSFCRRRKGPSLSRASYMYATSPGVDGFLDNKSRGAGVILDLHVSVPSSGSQEQSLRRLGSDGVEDDNEGGQDNFQSSFVMPVTSPFQNSQQKANSFPRCHSRQQSAGCGTSNTGKRTCSSLFRNRVQRNFSPLLLTDKTHLCSTSSSNLSRPATAPNTPSLLVFSGTEHQTNTNSCINMVPRTSESQQYSTDGCFSDDVEMTSPSDVNQRPSPPSPVLRDSCRTDPTSFYVSYEHAMESSNVRFMSRKTRSPKIMKKTFNPNLRQPYGGYQAFRQTTTRHRQFEGTWNLQLKPQTCDSPSTDRLSNLTLSSPVKNKDDPLLEVIGSRFSPASAATASVDHHHTPTSACTASSAGGFTSAFSNNIRKIPNRNSNTGEPFKLVSSNELKPRWRNRNPSSSSSTNNIRTSAEGVVISSSAVTEVSVPGGDSVTTSTNQASTASSLTHCNLEIVGLS